jgi:uncharacterized membrane protein YhaH (DUF805 family)
MEWYLKVLKNYVVFTGRARRTEYWMYALFNTIAAIVLAVVDNILGLSQSGGFGVFGGLYALAVFLPGLGVTVRRLHDTNRSGWFFLLILIPIIGSIALLIFFIQEGDTGPNKYGSDPKSEILPAAV